MEVGQRVTLTSALLMTLAVAGVMPQSTVAPHGADNTFCTQVTGQAPANLPNLPDSFSVRVEANILNKNFSTTLHEYYSHPGNIAAVRQVENGVESYFFYYYNDNQLLQVQPDSNGGRICFATDLSQSENSNMFGNLKVNSTTDRMYSVYGALHFQQDIQQYMGMEVVRGIPCHKFQSCQYWADMDATSNVTWYFSDENQWSSISGYSAPVRCMVNGVRYNQTTGIPYNYNHIYEFFDFQAVLLADDDHFDVPSNTYCYGEKNRRPLPNLPPAYSFSAEYLDVNAKSVRFIRELYDNSTKLLRYDYRDSPQANSPFGTRYMTQIHDYNTGVAYLIDVLRDQCTPYVIPANDFDNVGTSNGDVRMRNPKEFLDLNHKYAYQGVKTVRNIECDSWSVMRFDYPDPLNNHNPVTTWTWYFATTDWMKMMGFRDNLVMPVLLEIYSDTPNAGMHFMMNVYEYNAEEPDLFQFDISSCYNTSMSRNIAFLIQAKYSDNVASDVKTFKTMTMLSLQAFLNISPLRISKLDVQEAGNNILVTFDLLDKAPLPGDVQNPITEVSLDSAMATLKNGIGHDLKILLQTSSTSSLQQLSTAPAPQQFRFQSNSRARRAAAASPSVNRPAPPPKSSGFSGGAMGGMAVGMLVLGAVVGFLIMFAVYKVRGGTFAGLGGIGLERLGEDNPNSTE